MTNIRQRAFIPCHRHPMFDYHCHACLVETVIQVTKILEHQEEENNKTFLRRRNKG